MNEIEGVSGGAKGAKDTQDTKRAKGARGRYTFWGVIRLLVFTIGMVPVTVATVLVYIHVHPIRGPMSLAATGGSMKPQWRVHTASTGVMIRGWWIPAEKPDAPLVVLVHGHGGNRTHLLPEAQFLHEAGYALAMPDLRGHGLSGRAPVTFGALEGLEVVEFTREMIRRHAGPSTRVAFFGMSLGAVVALKAGTLMPEAVAVVADSPFSSLKMMGEHRLELVAPPALVPALWMGARALGGAITGVDPGEMEVTRWIHELGRRPLFLIHTEQDGNVPSEHSRILAGAYGGPTTLWISPGPGHVQTRKDEPSEYRRRILAFLGSAFAGREA